MKPLFRCEFCDKIGVEEEISKHEAECIHNYYKKSCFTCRHAENKIIKFNCKAGLDIPEGKMFEYCGSYERDEKDNISRIISPHSNLFGGLFG